MGWFNPITAPLIAGAIGAAADWFGGKRNARAVKDANAANERMQREFAQNGVRWRVEDAKAAGLHPLFAVGAQGSQASPSHVGDSSLGNAMSNMGQGISRAINATRTSEEREMFVLNMERAGLENELLRARIKSERALNPFGPAFPSQRFGEAMPGQGNFGYGRGMPGEFSRPAEERGLRPDVSYSQSDAGMPPMVPESLSESLEDDVIGKAMWRWRNNILPNFGFGSGPSREKLPIWANAWKWSKVNQQWEPGVAYPKKRSFSMKGSVMRNYGR